MNDTHPVAARVQIQLLREAGPERRLAMAMDLTTQTWRMAHAALARAHADLPDLQRRRLFVRLHYGRTLADEVQASLQRRSTAS